MAGADQEEGVDGSGRRQNGPLSVPSMPDKDIRGSEHVLVLWLSGEELQVYEHHSEYEGLGRDRGRVDRDGPGGLGRGLSWSRQDKPHPAKQPWVRNAGGAGSWGTGMSGRLFPELMESLNPS